MWIQNHCRCHRCKKLYIRKHHICNKNTLKMQKNSGNPNPQNQPVPTKGWYYFHNHTILIINAGLGLSRTEISNNYKGWPNPPQADRLFLNSNPWSSGHKTASSLTVTPGSHSNFEQLYRNQIARTTYHLKISLHIIIFFNPSNTSKVINQIQLPYVFLINFLCTDKK